MSLNMDPQKFWPIMLRIFVLLSVEVEEAFNQVQN